MTIETKNIKITDLILWDENARFPDKYYNSNETELIKYFFSNPKFEMKKFIEEVVNEFDLPQLEKLVVWSNENSLIVIEGNRRVTSYRVLANPDLVQDQKIRKFLKEQREKIRIDDRLELECVVSDSESDCLRYVDRKHIRRNNEVAWQEPERVNYAIRRGNNSQNNVIIQGITKIVRGLDLPNEIIDKVLGKGYVTSFFRIVASSPAKEKYQYEVTEDGKFKVNYPNYEDVLKGIIHTVLTKKDFDGNVIDSRTLNKKENIEAYIESVKPEDVHKVNEAIKNNTTEDIFGETSVNLGKATITGAKSKEATSKSTVSKGKIQPKGLFYSKDIPYTLNSTSLRILYDELKAISVSEFPNATHDLLRSFLECSLIFYFKDIKQYSEIKKSDPHNPKLGEILAYIINGKCDKITDKNLIEAIKIVKADYDQPYSIERMNMLNHNENCASTEKDVRKAWGLLEGLFKIILNPNAA